MPSTPDPLMLDEHQAKRLMLAQSIAAVDTAGQLVSPGQRAALEAAALQSTAASQLASPQAHTPCFLNQVAAGMVAAADAHAGAVQLSALLHAPPWLKGMACAVPLLAVLLGVLTDQVANPQRVDLLALPLLAVLGWNLLAYALMATAALYRQARHKPVPLLAAAPHWGAANIAIGLQRWMAGFKPAQRLGNKASLPAQVALHFHRRWLEASAALAAQRLQRLLHLAAACWAIGLVASLLTRGLVVEYRAGWESTFLDAEQVHRLLNAVFLPVVALFPLEPFSLDEVARLRFGLAAPALPASPFSGARWAWLYAGLFALLVVAPRLALAALATWRVRRLRQQVPVPLGVGNFDKLAASALPARIRLALHPAPSPGRAAVLQVLLQDADADTPVHVAAYDAMPGPLQARSLITTACGDALLLGDWPAAPASASPQTPPRERPPAARWHAWLPGYRPQPLLPPLAEAMPCDVLLQVVGQPSELDAVRKLPACAPLLVLVDADHGKGLAPQALLAACEAALRAQGRRGSAVVLPLAVFGPAWPHDSAWLLRLESLLQPAQQPGFARLRMAWDARQQARFGNSMAAIARHLVFAACQLQTLAPAQFRLPLLGGDKKRQDAALADAAKAAVSSRVAASADQLHTLLCQLHRLSPARSAALRHSLQGLDFSPPFAPSRQALAGSTGAAAGAVAGATVGAKVDLFTLGATLGAGAALGALVGGGAALAALAWRERLQPGQAAVVQFSDEMLLALLASCLVRYLALAHAARLGFASSASHIKGMNSLEAAHVGAGVVQPLQQAVLQAAVQHDAALRRCLHDARAASVGPADALDVALALERVLHSLVRGVLGQLYPPPPAAPLP